jgi:hypothetical protein
LPDCLRTVFDPLSFVYLFPDPQEGVGGGFADGELSCSWINWTMIDGDWWNFSILISPTLGGSEIFFQATGPGDDNWILFFLDLPGDFTTPCQNTVYSLDYNSHGDDYTIDADPGANCTTPANLTPFTPLVPNTYCPLCPVAPIKIILYCNEDAPGTPTVDHSTKVTLYLSEEQCHWKGYFDPNSLTDLFFGDLTLGFSGTDIVAQLVIQHIGGGAYGAGTANDVSHWSGIVGDTGDGTCFDLNGTINQTFKGADWVDFAHPTGDILVRS